MDQSVNTNTRLVILESPYAGEVEDNLAYARACMRDCLLRGEAPFASHLLYTQTGVLNDLVESERAQGIACGLAWGVHAEASVVYLDRGMSGGMLFGILLARTHNRPVELRFLPGYWQTPAGARHLNGRKAPDLSPPKPNLMNPFSITGLNLASLKSITPENFPTLPEAQARFDALFQELAVQGTFYLRLLEFVPGKDGRVPRHDEIRTATTDPSYKHEGSNLYFNQKQFDRVNEHIKAKNAAQE